MAQRAWPIPEPGTEGNHVRLVAAHTNQEMVSAGLDSVAAGYTGKEPIQSN